MLITKMAASMEQEKFDSKLLKKMRKHKQMLMNRDNLSVSENPSPIICVSNGGLENGVAYEEIHPLFKNHGECDVMMLPRKSYSIVCYTSVEDGKSAYTALNGYRLLAGDSRKSEVVLYLSYIDKAPNSISPSTEKPPGLILLEDVVTKDTAAKILTSVDWKDSSDSVEQKELKHRRVKHYGYEFKYSNNNVDPDSPLQEGVPEVFRPLLEKLLADGVIQHYPDQLTVNQYQPGQGIPPHVDTPSAFEDGLVSLSLGSQVIMEFRHPDGRQLSVLLPNRSAIIMTGESRYVWSHGITPRKSDIVPTPAGGLTLSNRELRTSFTFRKITGVKPEEEKSTNPLLPLTVDSAAQLESEHVHKVYEEIADHFSNTRHTPWPRIADFLRRQPPGSLLVDIGCGNGKYFGINKQLYELGSDRSSALVQICQQRGYQAFVGDILTIPVREGVCDVCLCIAVVHHLSTQERRLSAIKELLKVLRSGGKALIYVWAMEQELNKVKSKYLKEKTKQEPSASSDRLTSDQDISNVQKPKSHTPNESSEKNEGETNDNGREICDSSREMGKESEVNNRTHDKVDSISEDLNKAQIGKEVEETSSQSDDKDKGDMKSKEECPMPLSVHVNRTEFKQQDVLVPWQLKKNNQKDKNYQNEKNEQKEKSGQKDSRTYHRFYHVFQKGELEELCLQTKLCKVVDSYYDQGNWAVILEKL